MAPGYASGVGVGRCEGPWESAVAPPGGGVPRETLLGTSKGGERGRPVESSRRVAGRTTWGGLKLTRVRGRPAFRWPWPCRGAGGACRQVYGLPRRRLIEALATSPP